MQAILGIDLGTTAVKVGLYRLEDAHLLALSTQEYPLQTPAPGQAELPAPVYWQAIVTAVHQLTTTCPQAHIASIGLSSQGQTFVLLDRNYSPLRPAIVWLDTRATDQCTQLLNTLGPKAYKHRTGSPFPQPISSAPKILWIRQHQPQIWAQTAHIAMLPEYIAHCLTGQLGCDPSNMSTHGLYGEQGWWEDAMQTTGVERHHFGTIVPTGQPIGTLTATAAKTLGLTPGIPIGAGSNDQLTGAIGVANVTPGIISGAIGTAMALVGTLPGDQYTGDATVVSHPHAIAGHRFALTFSMTTGILLRWYRDNFGHGLTYDQLVEMAATIPPGADGLTFLPHFSGTATPTFDSSVRGGILGLSLNHGPAHIIRAILEAVGYTVRDSVQHLATSYPLDWTIIRALGGATHSPIWMQLIADIAGIPVEQPTNSEAAVLGAALCGAKAADLVPDLAQAATNHYQALHTYHPGPQSPHYHTHYATYRQHMQTLYPNALGLD